MVKLIAPLFSQAASGSIGGTHTHASWKGRQYARQLVIPANPKSPAQHGSRAMMTFLSQGWKTLTIANQMTWAAAAKVGAVSPFNSYVAANQKRWTQFTTPGQASPIGGTGTNATMGAQSAAAGVGQVALSIAVTAAANTWGLLIHVYPITGATLSRNNVRLVIPINGTTTLTPIITGLVAGVAVFVKITPFTTDGLKGTAGAELTATPT